MSIPAADILASLSSAPPEKTVRTTRPANVPRVEGHHKGFSAVLRKVQDAEEKDELHKTDDTSSLPRTDERPQVKEARSREKDVRGRDGAGTDTEPSKSVSQSAKRDEQVGKTTNNDSTQTRTAQSDSSSSQSGKTSELDSSKDSTSEALAREVASSVTDTEAHLTTDTQGQVPLFLSALIASTTNQQPVDRRPDSNKSNQQVVGDGPQQEDESSKSIPVRADTSASSPAVPQNGDDHASLTSRTSTLQSQQSPALNQPTAQVEHTGLGDVAPASRQSSTSHEMAVPDKLDKDKMVGQDASVHQLPSDNGPSNVKADSFELKDMRVALESIRKDQAIVNPKGDAEPKIKGQLLDHPLLSSAQEYSVGVQDRDTSAVKNMLLPQQGAEPIVSLAEEFREMWAGQQDGKQGQGDGKFPQAAVPDQQIVNAQRAESFAVGAQGAPASGSGTLSHGGPVTSHAQAAQSAHMPVPSPLPVGTKSVVFDVIQPELGHVNVRVAMANDVVHAYLSADRQDVGQSLLSGQDRLQSSLQASGLDMGQFRVDIDRQSAGRSFQQGFSQEQQDRAWNQTPSWMERERTSVAAADGRPTLQGLLNVVA